MTDFPFTKSHEKEKSAQILKTISLLFSYRNIVHFPTFFLTWQLFKDVQRANI